MRGSVTINHVKAFQFGRGVAVAMDATGMGADVVHRDFSKVRHIAAVQAAVRKYKEAFAKRTATNGMDLKAAEEELNRQVEKALSPK